MDAELLQELKQVAINAAEVQSVMFSTLWSENLAEFFKPVPILRNSSNGF